MQNVLTAHARHHSPFLESQSVSLGKQALSLEFHRHCCIFFTRTVEALSHFPQSPLQLRLIHEERQYPNDHKSIGILFQNRGKRSLRVSEMSYLSGLLFLSSNGVDLRVKFYYMHLKNVKLEFQRGIEKWPESGWDINLRPSGLMDLRQRCPGEVRPFGQEREVGYRSASFSALKGETEPAFAL